MSTNAYVYMREKGSDKLKGLYIHWDGYKESVGNKLFNHYQNRSKVEKLMHYQALSTLGTTPTLLRNYDKLACMNFHLRDQMEEQNKEDKYGYLEITKATLEKFCELLGDRSFFKKSGLYFDDKTASKETNACPDTTIEKLNEECVEYGGELNYLYDDDDQWKRYSDRAKKWLPITQKWIDNGKDW